MRFLRHFISTKGFMHAAERMGQVAWRFTLGGRRFDRIMDLLLEDLEQTETRATFFVAASCLGRHKDRIRRLQDKGHEIASHGLYHSRMDLLDKRDQLRILHESYRRLAAAGFDAKGFRSPYLNFNEQTNCALSESPFTWTSQEIVFWDRGIMDREAIQRLNGLYHFSTSDERLALPRFRGRLVEVPIIAPEDEMLIERCRIVEPEKLYRIWQGIFDAVAANGELFHLLIHPERYRYSRVAACRLMHHRVERSKSVWCATLGEVAEWWQRRSRWQVEFDAHEVRVEVPQEGWLLNADKWLIGHEGPIWRFRSYMPRLQLLPDADGRLERFLQSQGFLVERTNGTSSSAFLLPERELKPGGERALLARLEQVNPPLPRVGRWPQPYTSAASISADICAIDLRDFIERARHF